MRVGKLSLSRYRRAAYMGGSSGRGGRYPSGQWGQAGGARRGISCCGRFAVKAVYGVLIYAAIASMYRLNVLRRGPRAGGDMAQEDHVIQE